MAIGQFPFIPGISAASADPAPPTAAQTAAQIPTQSPPSITPSPALPVSPATITREQMEYLNKTFDDRPGGAAPIVAKSIVGELSQQTPDLFTYDGLRSGTAPLFDLLPNFQGKPPEERQLSDNQIIKMLARDPEGNIIEPGSFFSGMGRELLPQAGGFGGAYAGAKAGYALQAPIPPANPALVATKFAIPVATSFMGFFGGYGTGREITDQLLGDERPVLPGTSSAYEAGKTAMGALAWMPLPYLISDKISFGGAQLLDNLANLKALRAPVGPPTREAMPGYQAAIAEYEAGRLALGSGAEKLLSADKGPRSTRLIKNIEQLLSRTGEYAKTSPIMTGAIEGIAAAGQTGAAALAEESAPGEVGVRIGSEVTGAMLPSFLMAGLATKLPLIGVAFNQVRQKGGLREAAQPLLQYRENKVVQKIMDALENNGEDVEGLIETLANPNFLLDEAGEPIKLTAGAKTGSPTLLAFEMAADQLSGGALAKDRVKGASKAIDAYKVLVMGMMSSGDQEMMQLAATLAEDFFSASIRSRVTNATDDLLAATERVAGDTPVDNMQLSEKLFNLMENQLKMARDRERSLWRAVPEQEITTFKNQAGEEIDYPEFLDRWEQLLPTTEEARGPILRSMPDLQRFVQRKRTEFGLDAGDGAAAPTVVDDVADFSALGKEQTDKFQPALGVAGDATGFRVFQRNATPEKDGFTGRVTTLVDGQGNEVRLNRDPNNQIQPYVMEIQNGVLDDGISPTAVVGMSDSTLEGAIARAAEYMRRDPDRGGISFSARPADKVSAEAAAPAATPDADAPSVTITELEEMRSSALNVGRQLRANGDLNGSRVAFGLAEALLDDMNSFDQTTSAAYHTARAYSKSLNDTFTRAFAGDAMDTTKKGSERIAPELLATKLFVGGSDPTFLRVEQIRNVGKFAEEQGFEGAEAATASIDGTVLSLLRNARTASFDPTTGEINLRQLDKWRRDNKGILDVFPALDADLQDARKAQVLLNEERLAEKAADKNLQGQITFKSLLPGRVTNPTYVVSEALADGQKRKWPAMNALLDVANGRNLEATTGVKGFELPEETILSARNGLKSSVLEWAMTKSGATGRSFKPSVAYEALFQPLKNERVGGNLVDWMVKNELMPKEQANNLKSFLQEMMRFELAEVNGTIDEIVEQAGPLLDFYLRVTGSNLGAKASGLLGGGGGDLIARSAGSKIMRQAFEEVPEAFQVDVMTKMMEDPEMLAAFLRRGVTEREKINIAGRASNMLLDFVGRPVRRVTPSVGREMYEGEPEEPPTAREPQASVQQPRPNLMAQRFGGGQPVTPRVTPRPPMAAPVAQAPAVRPPMAAPVAQAPAPQGTANPQQRAQMAALFPFDETLGAATGAAGGIGSLFS